MKTNWKQILEDLDKWKAQDDKNQEAIEACMKVLAPGCHPPVLSPCLAKAYVEGVCRGREDLKEDLEDILYERSLTVVTEKGEYDFTKRKDQIACLEDEYPNF